MEGSGCKGWVIPVRSSVCGMGTCSESRPVGQSHGEGPEAWHAPTPAGSYGSTKRYKSFERLTKVNECTVLGAGGELSDYQYIVR